MRLIDADKITEGDIMNYLGFGCAPYVPNIMGLIEAQETVELPESTGDWIPCSKEMPKEYEDFFAMCCGTNFLEQGVIKKSSLYTIVTVETPDAGRRIDIGRTLDGLWELNHYFYKDDKVIAWLKPPRVYMGGLLTQQT